MIYKNITFKAAPFSYDLVFDDRITLVGGDSGTGKTVLYEMLEDLRFTDEYKRIKLFIINQMIISKNPQFTGISARQQLEFTTHLLLTD